MNLQFDTQYATMSRVPTPKSVELEEEYYHVRFRDPGAFTDIRTPEWATKAAEDVSKGSKVRTGKRKGSDEWVVQSILIPKRVGKSAAKSQATKIIEKIET